MQAGQTLAESVCSNLYVNAFKHHTIMQIITAVFLCTMCMVHVLVYEMCFCLSFCTECVERQAFDLEVTGCPISGLPWALGISPAQILQNHLLAWIWLVFCDKEAENQKWSKVCPAGPRWSFPALLETHRWCYWPAFNSSTRPPIKLWSRNFDPALWALA